MNCDSMQTYIKYVANNLSRALGVGDVYDATTNPFDFMDLLSLQGKTNFFEKRVGEYTKSSNFSRNAASFESDVSKLEFTLDF